MLPFLTPYPQCCLAGWGWEPCRYILPKDPNEWPQFKHVVRQRIKRVCGESFRSTNICQIPKSRYISEHRACEKRSVVHNTKSFKSHRTQSDSSPVCVSSVFSSQLLGEQGDGVGTVSLAAWATTRLNILGGLWVPPHNKSRCHE